MDAMNEEERSFLEAKFARNPLLRDFFHDNYKDYLDLASSVLKTYKKGGAHRMVKGPRLRARTVATQIKMWNLSKGWMGVLQVIESKGDRLESEQVCWLFALAVVGHES